MTQNAQNAPEAVDLPVRSSTITALVGLDALTVYVAGELDITSNTEATVAFADNTGLRVVVDMTDIDFVDCRGHRAIAAPRRNPETRQRVHDRTRPPVNAPASSASGVAVPQR